MEVAEAGHQLMRETHSECLVIRDIYPISTPKPLSEDPLKRLEDSANPLSKGMSLQALVQIPKILL